MQASIYQFGMHAVQALLEHQPKRMQRLLILAGRHDEKIKYLLKLAKQNNIEVDTLSRAELDRLVKDGNHQGVIACCNTSKNTYTEHDIETLVKNIAGPPFILLLDGVQDPHNLGACFRTAAAAGIHLIIVPKDKAVGMSPVVSKVASGAAEIVPFVQVTNLVRTMKWLKEAGIWIYGAAEGVSASIYQTNLTGPLAIVLGAEGMGLRRLTRENCDGLVSIPTHGRLASLNVSVATGICLFEAVRQRIEREDKKT